MNYSAHCIEHLKNSISAEFRDFPQTILQADFSIRGIRAAEKFLLPLDGIVMDGFKIDNLHMPLMKLPYPTCAVEFPTSSSKVPKSLVLMCGIGNPIHEDYRIEMRFFMYAKESQLWLMNPFSASVSPNLNTDVTWVLIRPEFKNHAGVQEWRMDCAADLRAALSFLVVANCENIKRDKVAPSGELNKARHARGKEPFDSYWVLDIFKEQQESMSEGGKHDSPRLHFRRGHIRRLHSGKAVWVRHCMVGNPDKGVVEKTYAVH